MSDTSDCPHCINTVETMAHYFVYCPAHNDIRKNLITQLPVECCNVNTLTKGSERYSIGFNCFIQKIAQVYIQETGRF